MKSARALLLYEDNSRCDVIRSIMSAEGCEIDEGPLDTPIPHPAVGYCLILFDVLRPEKRILEIARGWRDALPDAGILLAGGRTAPSRRIAVLEAGVDAYLTGPDLELELRARVRASVRHFRSHQTRLRRLRFAGGVLDLEARVLTLNGRNIHLTPTEFGILDHLIQNANRTVPSGDLVKVLWGDDPLKGVHSLRLFIRRLRQKIEPDLLHPIYIVTHPAVGYRLQIESEPSVRAAETTHKSHR